MVVEYKLKGEGITLAAMEVVKKVLEFMDAKNVTYEEVKGPTKMTKEEYYKMIEEASKGNRVRMSAEEMKKYLKFYCSFVLIQKNQKIY